MTAALLLLVGFVRAVGVGPAPGVFRAAMHVHENAVVETFSDVDVWTTMTQGFEAGDLGRGWSHSGGTLTATTEAHGTYFAYMQASFADGANSVFQFGLFLDESEQHTCHFERKLSVGGDIGSASSGCFVTIGAGADDVTLRAKQTNAPVQSLTIKFASVVLVRVQ